MSRNIKILVLSDIHLRSDKDNKMVIKMIGDLRKYFESNQLTFHYIIFNGDLVFSGIKEEYVLFNDIFLNLTANRRTNLGPIETELMTFCSKQIFIVPGNHDCKQKYLIDEIKKHLLDLNSFSPLTSTLSEIQETYNAAFSAAANKIQFGCNLIEDENNNFLFVPINSALKSIGDVSHYYNYEKYKYSEKLIGIDPLNIIYNSDFFIEMGNLEYNELDSLLRIIIDFKNKNPNGFVLTFAHHPIEWLNMSQVYSKSKNYDGNDMSEIKALFHYSDCHLMGHEHIDPTNNYSRMENCWKLKLGMLMDNNIYKNIDTNQGYGMNWAHILEINNDKINLDYLFYDDKSTWKSYFKDSLDILIKGVDYRKLLETTSDKELVSNYKKLRENYYSYINKRIALLKQLLKEDKLFTKVEVIEAKLITYFSNLSLSYENSKNYENCIAIWRNDCSKIEIYFMIGCQNIGLEIASVKAVLSHIKSINPTLGRINSSSVYIHYFDYYSLGDITFNDNSEEPEVMEQFRELLTALIKGNERNYQIHKYKFFEEIRTESCFLELHDCSFSYALRLVSE